MVYEKGFADAFILDYNNLFGRVYSVITGYFRRNLSGNSYLFEFLNSISLLFYDPFQYNHEYLSLQGSGKAVSPFLPPCAEIK